MSTSTETILRFIEVGGIFIAAVGAVIFGALQYLINRRMKNLQDYVAVSIVPQPDLRLQVLNVGKINLYIHRWEVGRLNESYTKAVLIPSVDASSITINLTGLNLGEHDFRMYIKDEHNKKYLSTGKVFVDPVSIIHSNSVINPVVESKILDTNKTSEVRINLRALSYKTEKYKWVL